MSVCAWGKWIFRKGRRTRKKGLERESGQGVRVGVVWEQVTKGNTRWGGFGSWGQGEEVGEGKGRRGGRWRGLKGERGKAWLG